LLFSFFSVGLLQRYFASHGRWCAKYPARVLTFSVLVTALFGIGIFNLGKNQIYKEMKKIKKKKKRHNKKKETHSTKVKQTTNSQTNTHANAHKNTQTTYINRVRKRSQKTLDFSFISVLSKSTIFF
jgi:cell division protein FtsI/penicillin-binding protein 2